jgi:hypothetical protein
LSPFTGRDDKDTSENIKRCDLKFPSEFFTGISDNAFDFMRRLIVKSKQGRMSIFEALEHPWLAGDNLDETRIPNSRYDAFNARLKARAFLPLPRIPIGKIAHLSSLRKHYPKEYSIYSSYFDRRDAAPRYVLRPRNQHVIEGQNAEFRCIIVAASPPIVSWYRDGAEIKQSCKHMKKYRNLSYDLEIKRCTLDDKGEYIVKASNHYGERDMVVFLTVERKFFLASNYGTN